MLSDWSINRGMGEPERTGRIFLVGKMAADMAGWHKSRGLLFLLDGYGLMAGGMMADIPNAKHPVAPNRSQQFN